jgi:hypothetical protein
LPILQASLIALICAAVAAAALFASRRRRWWLVLYAIALLLISLILIARRFPTLAFRPPISWVAAGRTSMALLGPAAALLLIPLFPQLKNSRQRALVAIFLIVFILNSSIYPFISPVLAHSELQRLPTYVSPNGVCLQSTSYDCGPAAAVTALRKLGIPAQESEIALLADTCPAAGTSPDTLARILRDRYAGDGLLCEYRPFASVRDLPQDAIILATMKLTFLIDHFVAVLAVTDDDVVLGDPLHGYVHISHQDFAQKWRFTGIVLRRTQ